MATSQLGSSASRSASSGGCGAVPDTGACSGAMLQVCDLQTGRVNTEDCTTAFPDAPGTCAVLAGTAQCAVTTGGNCIASDFSQYPCAGAGMGCKTTLVSTDGGSDFQSTCGETPSCIPPAPDATYDNTCSNDARLIYDCTSLAQPDIYDCAAFAGAPTTCSTTNGQGHCDMPAGALCDTAPGNTFAIFACNAGLICDGVTETSYGQCVPAGTQSSSRPASSAGASGATSAASAATSDWTGATSAASAATSYWTGATSGAPASSSTGG